MDTRTFRKFCPVCKMVNDASDVVCKHCGAQLGESATNAPATRPIDEAFQLTEELRDQITRERTPPPRGLSIFLLNNGEPIALSMEQELILGRAEDPTSESMVDLTDHDGFALGVSRRHAMIQAAGETYVLIDLHSSNGTWLNGERLVPSRSYDLPSGGVIQLGRLKLIVAYMKPASSKKTKS